MMFVFNCCNLFLVISPLPPNPKVSYTTLFIVFIRHNESVLIITTLSLLFQQYYDALYIVSNFAYVLNITHSYYSFIDQIFNVNSLDQSHKN